MAHALVFLPPHSCAHSVACGVTAALRPALLSSATHPTLHRALSAHARRQTSPSSRSSFAPAPCGKYFGGATHRDIELIFAVLLLAHRCAQCTGSPRGICARRPPLCTEAPALVPSSQASEEPACLLIIVAAAASGESAVPELASEATLPAAAQVFHTKPKSKNSIFFSIYFNKF